jgi:hypothetical protein
MNPDVQLTIEIPAVGVAITVTGLATLDGEIIIDPTQLTIYDGLEITIMNFTSYTGSVQITVNTFDSCTQVDATPSYSETGLSVLFTVSDLCSQAVLCSFAKALAILL